MNISIILVIIIILAASFIGYDIACYQLIKLIKGSRNIPLNAKIPGFSIYYYHRYIKNIKDKDEKR